MKRIRLTLTLLLAAACGCSTPKKQVRQIGELPPGTFEVAWEADPKAKSVSAFYLVGDLLFVFDKSNTVTAFDFNGSLKFRATVGEPGDVLGMPIVQPDRILFPTTGTVELWTKNGIKTRTVTLPQPVRSPGVAVGDIVYFGADSEQGGRLAAVDLSRPYNLNRWTVLTGLIGTKPAYVDGVLYCPTQDGRVYAINQDRTPLWPSGPEMKEGIFQTDGKIIAALKADETGVFVPSTDTKLYCLNPGTGRIKWTYYAGASLSTSPSLTADMVYQYVEGTGLVALVKKNPEPNAMPKWVLPEGVQLVADDGRYAYARTQSGSVVAVDRATGKVAFSTERSDLVRTVTTQDAKNPAAFALTRSGSLVCIRPVLKTGVVGELAMLSQP